MDKRVNNSVDVKATIMNKKLSRRHSSQLKVIESHVIELRVNHTT